MILWRRQFQLLATLHELAYCEGAFRERHISDVQLMLTKNSNPAILYGEPWQPASELALGHPATDEALQVGV